MELNCRQFLNELCDYLDGTEDAQQLVETERHLARCRKCRIVSETTRQTIAMYRRMYRVCTLPLDVEERLTATLSKHFEK